MAAAKKLIDFRPGFGQEGSAFLRAASFGGGSESWARKKKFWQN